MSFWTILSCCFLTKTTREDTIQPRGTIELNGSKVSALFDTGSAITLVDAKYMDLIESGQKRGPSIRFKKFASTKVIALPVSNNALTLHPFSSIIPLGRMVSSRVVLVEK